MSSAPPASPPRCRLNMLHVQGSHASFDAMEIVHAARRFAPHFFGSYAIGVVESGTCRVTTPHGSWLASPGSCLAFAPGELHCAEVVSDEAYGYRVVYLPTDVMQDVLATGAPSSGHSPSIRTPVVAGSSISATFRDVHRHLVADPHNARAEGRLLACTRELVRQAAGEPRARHPAAELAIVEHARALLASRVATQVRLEEVAARCGVTVFRLIRVFRRVMGLSPYAWLVLLRVNHARRLLDRGEPVSGVAYSCGFSDQSHLTRTFKRTLGVPPGQYLRSISRRVA